MVRMGKYLTIFLVVMLTASSLSIGESANAQIAETAEPLQARSFLGPVHIRSSGDSGTNVRIIMPQNQTSVNGPVEVLFCINIALLPYSSPPYGDIGYSIDNTEVFGIVTDDLINQTITHGANADEATIWAKLTLSNISGNHNLIIYVGAQFEGTPENPQLQRYEVWAYSTVNFSATSVPSPTVPEFPATIAIVFLSVTALAVVSRRKHLTGS